MSCCCRFLQGRKSAGLALAGLQMQDRCFGVLFSAELSSCRLQEIFVQDACHVIVQLQVFVTLQAF